jgi:hypothetical protein
VVWFRLENITTLLQISFALCCFVFGRAYMFRLGRGLGSEASNSSLGSRLKSLKGCLRFHSIILFWFGQGL